MINENSKDLKSPPNIQTVGQLLKSKREEQKISIREISTKTKIRQNLIIDLENDNLAKLPNRAYVIGFLKTLTQTLGINYTEAIELFERVRIETSGEKIPDSGFYLEDNQEQRKSTVMTYVLVILSIAFIIGIYIFVKISKEANNLVAPTAKKTNIPSVGKTTSFNDEKVKHKVAELPIINLSIKAIEGSCWIAYQVDNNPIVKYIMNKGKIILLTGHQIKLQMGNYKAISIEQDNVPINISKNTKSTTAYLIFPERLKDKIKPPFFIFHTDGTVDSKQQYEENVKAI